MAFNVKGYHTCKDKGGVQHIRENTPFLSRADNQWLGQGYYFWTDSDYWAKRWMSEPKVITKFDIAFEKSKLFDLVGDVSHQELFQSMCGLFGRGTQYGDAYTEKYGEEITVGSVISFLRAQSVGSNDYFPFWAVRAKDKRYVSKIPFSAVGRKTELFLVEPHQLCVYEEYKPQCIAFERFVHPAHYQ